MRRIIRNTINGFLSSFGLQISRTPKEVHPKQNITKNNLKEDWKTEREYWATIIKDFYKTEYGLELHPIQYDDSIVPPQQMVDLIQSRHMSLPDGFFGSGYRNIYAYLTELKDTGFSPVNMKTILEFGVGLGRLIIHFFPFKAQLHGCDVTDEVLEHTRSKIGKRVELKLTSFEPTLPYDSNYFDFIYANSVFTHIPCSMQEKWISELHRITKPGGCVIATYLDGTERFSNYSYVEFHKKFQRDGWLTWNIENGVLTTTYVDRQKLFDLWGRYFKVIELRTQYRDQNHLIVSKSAANSIL